MAAVVLLKVADDIVRQTIFPGNARESPVLEPVQPRIQCSNPNCIGFYFQALHGIARQPIGRAELFNAAVFDSPQPAFKHSEPDRAVRALSDSPYLRLNQTLGFAVRRYFAPFVTQEPILRPDPRHLVRTMKHGSNCCSQTLQARHAFESVLTVLTFDENAAFPRSSPDSSLGILRNGPHK